MGIDRGSPDVIIFGKRTANECVCYVYSRVTINWRDVCIIRGWKSESLLSSVQIQIIFKPDRLKTTNWFGEYKQTDES